MRAALAVLILSRLADTATTFVGLQAGMEESKPMASAFLGALGPLGLLVQDAVLIVPCLLMLAFLPARWRLGSAVLVSAGPITAACLNAALIMSAH